jgi:hypothetical protein
VRIKSVFPAVALSLSVALLAPALALTQQPQNPVPLTEEQQKAKDEREKKGVELLDQVLSESQSMRLPENRARVQITAAELLWERDQGRARSIFLAAAASIIDQMRALDPNDRQYANLLRGASQLRQELILAVARHDSTLAYQLLASTRPPAPTQPQAVGRPSGPGGNPIDAEANLERNLLAQIAASDPKVALQNAEEMLAKGEYSSAMASVLSNLQKNDKEAAAKFQEKLLRKLGTEDLLTTQGASALAVALLRNGPRVEMVQSQSSTSSTATQSSGGTLTIAAYRDLMETVINSALKAAPAVRNAQGNVQGNVRGNASGPGAAGSNTGNNQGGATGNRQGNGQGNAGRPATPQAPGGAAGRTQSTQSQTLTTAQIEQNAARGLVGSLQAMLPQIDQYLPARSAAVRQKMTELGMNPDRRGGQFGPLIQQGDSQSLLTAAATAPQQSQPRLYQQAALKALDEGNIDGARQIANEHLEGTLKTSVLQSIDLQLLAKSASAEKIDEIRQSVGRLKTDEERVRTLIQLANSTGKQNEKLARDLLEDARLIVARRATSYQQFDNQLRVARAFAPLDPAKAVEVLDIGISQLNELLSAAAVLNGFEVNIFKDGELPIQAGSQLTGTLARYAQQIGALSKSNFDLAASAADKFQSTEARMIARLAIIRSVLGNEGDQASEQGGPFGAGRPFPANLPQPNRRQP